MTIDVVPIHLATVTFPKGSPLEGKEGRIFGFAIEHPDGVLLFETGLGTGNPRVDELLHPERRLLPEALSDEGIAPADVVAIANSHPHIDHCGQNHLFPGVPIYVQRTEYEAAQSPNYTVPGWVDFSGASYELLDGDAGMIESVRLISTPGHTPGHQSLVVAWDRERYAQSVARLRDLDPRRVFFSHDETVWEP